MTIELQQSAHSLRVSLEAIRRGEAGLDEHRAGMLRRVPETGNWAEFPHEHLEMKDLAYLTAAMGHEFAILRGKRRDVLFHGSARRCTFVGVIEEWLLSKKLMIYGHSHPGEDMPHASEEDREILRMLGQKSSRLISGLTGIEREFYDNEFEIL